jgi:excisionase family DNA binding protein
VRELIDQQEAAEFLQVSARTVLRRTADGTMPGSRRIGGVVRWSRSILKAWVLAGCPEGAEEFEVRCQRWIPDVLTGLDSEGLPEDVS